MPQGQELQRRLEELAGEGLTGQEAALAVLIEDYDTPVGELQELLELKAMEVGRVKAIARQRLQKAEREAKTGEEPPREPQKPSPRLSPPKAQLSLSGEEFRRVADQVLGAVDSRRKDYLAELYDRQPVEIKRDRRALENFLFRHGLTYMQVYGFLDLIMPGSYDQAIPGQPQVMATDPRTGQQVPVIVMPQQGGGAPYIIQPPAAPPPQPGLTAEEVRRIIRDDLWERERLTPSPSPPPSPHMARYPLIGDDGRQVKDADGTPLWIERPMDPNMSMLEFLRPVLFRETPPAPQALDMEKLTLQVREIVRQEVGDTRARGEEVDVEKITLQVREQITAQFSPQISALEKEVESQRRQTEIEEAVQAAVKPLMLQLSDYQGKTNLEKDERAQVRAQQFVRDTLDGVKGEMKDTLAMAVLPYYATLEQEKGLPEGTLTGPIMDRVRGTGREFKPPTAFERSRLLRTMHGWAGE